MGTTNFGLGALGDLLVPVTPLEVGEAVAELASLGSISIVANTHSSSVTVEMYRDSILFCNRRERDLQPH